MAQRQSSPSKTSIGGNPCSPKTSSRTLVVESHSCPMEPKGTFELQGTPTFAESSLAIVERSPSVEPVNKRPIAGHEFPTREQGARSRSTCRGGSSSSTARTNSLADFGLTLNARLLESLPGSISWIAKPCSSSTLSTLEENWFQAGRSNRAPNRH